MPISDILIGMPSYRPYSNITPFTIRDGATYLLQLEALKDWWRDSVVPHIDAEINGLTGDWKELTTQLMQDWETKMAEMTVLVNDAVAGIDNKVELAEAAKEAAEAARDLAAMYASQAEEVQDEAIAGIVGDTEPSQTRELLDTLYASVNSVTTLADSLTALATDVTGVTDTLNGRLADAALVQRFRSRVLVSDPQFGAKGDGTTDDTAAIQAAVDYVSAAGGGIVAVPQGVHMIMADSGASVHADAGGIKMKSNVTLELQRGAILRAIPITTIVSKIIRIMSVNNVAIIGEGVIDGNRANAVVIGTGEWGYGISISAGNNILIEGVRTINTWGDGINVQRKSHSEYVSPTNVVIRGVLADNNRRQGISVEDGVGVLIEDCVVTNTVGVMPQCGIDIEPPDGNGVVRDVTIRKTLLKGNARRGITIAESAKVTNVVIDDCVFDSNGNGNGTGVVEQFKAIMGGSGLTFVRNRFTGSLTDICFQVDGPKDGARITGNDFDKSVRLYGTALISGFPLGTLFSGNTVRGGLKCEYQSFVTIADNTFLPPDTVIAIDFSGTINTNHAKVSGNMIRGGLNAIKLGVTNYMITAQIVNNMMINQRAAAMLIAGRNLLIKTNTIVGACVDSGTAAVEVLSEPNGNPYITFEDNTLVKPPYGIASPPNVPTYALIKAGTILFGRFRGNRVDSTFVFSDGTPPVGNGTIFADNDIPYGTTAQRPPAAVPGTVFFDTTLGKPVWRKGTSAWVDATGATV